MAGIDHIVHCVRDPEAIRARMAGLGFTLTPRAVHPFGTGNSLVQLDGSFLEFLHVEDASLIRPAGPGGFSFASFNRDYLAAGEGMSMLVLESADARADQARYAAAGLDTYAPFDFSRQARLPGGEAVTVGFSLAFVTHRDMARAGFFACQQHAPQHFWKAEYQRHANTAQSVAEVALMADDPARYAGFVVRLIGRAADETGRAVAVDTGRGRLAVLDPAGFAAAYGVPAPALDAGPVFAGYRIAVASLAAVGSCAAAAGLALTPAGAGLTLAPADGFGAAIGFVEVA